MKQLHRYWGGIMVRGIVALVFGLAALFMPGFTFETLVVVFAVFALIDGIVGFFVGLFSQSIALVLEGLLGALIGALVLMYTAQAVLIFVIVFSAWAIITGIVEIVGSFSLRKHIANEIWLLLTGVISVLFGLLIFINPVISVVAITYLIGIYAVIFGVFFIALAFKLKSYKPSKSKK